MSAPDMRTFAIAMHELATSYIAAGFTRAEAIDLTKTQIAATIHADRGNK